MGCYFKDKGSCTYTRHGTIFTAYWADKFSLPCTFGQFFQQFSVYWQNILTTVKVDRIVKIIIYVIKKLIPHSTLPHPPTLTCLYITMKSPDQCPFYSMGDYTPFQFIVSTDMATHPTWPNLTSLCLLKVLNHLILMLSNLFMCLYGHTHHIWSSLT